MRRSTFSSQRGAVLIHVAIALLGLIAFSTFVTDYGVMWVSRGQAQTAADAGALSGALSLAFDNSTDFAGAKAKAQAAATANLVFGASPDVQLDDVTFPECPPNTPGLPDTCVKVDVFRNQTRGNPLPMFFGNLVGVGEQGVRATATAQIVTGTHTDCLKPWAILDRWDEWNGIANDYPGPDPDFNHTSTFDKYSDGKGGTPPPEPDLYVPPGGAGGSGTGFTLPADEGRPFAVKVGDSADSISAGWFRAIRIPRLDGNTGGSVYRDNIEGCGGLPNGFAAPDTVCPTDIGNDNAAYWASRGCYRVEPGNMIGPTKQGVDALVARDSSARWSGGGIVDSAFSPATSSPRVVPIGVLDIDTYLAADPTGSNGIVKLVNIYGFFVEGMGDLAADGTVTLSSGGKSVIGRIMTYPSMGVGNSNLPVESSFLRQVILVR
jgi:hypothetical protein